MKRFDLDAKDEGTAAYKQGFNLSENPYSKLDDQLKSDSWDAGWALCKEMEAGKHDS